jgi:hypothetical protein
MTALDGHDALWCAGYMQSGICLQTNNAMRFCTRSNAGKTSDAFSVIGNDKVIHELPYSRCMKKGGFSSLYNYNKRHILSSDSS